MLKTLQNKKFISRAFYALIAPAIGFSFSSQANSQVNDLTVYGRTIPAWEAGVEGGIPDVPVMTSVTDHGAIADDGLDDSAAFLQALASLGGVAGAVEIPAGEFNLNASIAMPSGAVLRGAGADQTLLTLNHSGHGFTVNGSGEGTSEATAANGYPQILSGAVQGSKTITLDDASSFEVGDGIELVQAYDPALHETQTAWNKSWAKRLIGQFSIVTAKSGQQLTLADAVRIDMDMNLGSWAAPIDYAGQIGFEGFRVQRADTSDTYIFQIKRASNVWIKGVKSQYAAKGHFYVALSRRFELRDSWLEYASSYGGGGHGYGVELLQRTTGSLVINNVFHHLRHAMMLHLGANGNVMAYNYSNDPYQDDGNSWVPPDISLHGHYAYSNLIEANMVAEIGAGDYWGPIGPDNLMFRNTVTDDNLHSEDHSDGQLAIGNQFQVGGIQFDNSTDSNTWVLAANYSDVSGDLDNVSPATANLVDSYYFATAPSFMSGYNWPATGSDTTPNNLPAKDAFLNGVMPTSGTPTPEPEPDPEPEPEPDPEPVNDAPLSCTATAGSNWSTGNVVNVTLENTSASTTVTSWAIALNFSDGSSITKMWSATWVPGSPDVAENLSWNGELEPGEMVDFGFKLQKGSAQADPVLPDMSGGVCQ